MNKLKLAILCFLVAFCIPFSYLIIRTYAGVAREEQSQLRFFAETLFDHMQEELAALVQREEARTVEAYHVTLAAAGGVNQPSPLAGLPTEGFILGYLQNNPDGSMQTPLTQDVDRAPAAYRDLIEQLRQVNQIFNNKKWTLVRSAGAPPAQTPSEDTAPVPADSFAERYLFSKERKGSKSALGQQNTRLEEITASQAVNLAREKKNDKEAQPREAPAAATTQAPEQTAGQKRAVAATAEKPAAEAEALKAMPDEAAAPHQQLFQVEVAPLQSVFIDAGRIYIFRRVAMDNQIIRQGFVLLAEPFLRHLAEMHFNPQPMAGFTRLQLMVNQNGRQQELVKAGAAAAAGALVASRTFPAPFNFISASVSGAAIPASAVRRTLNTALSALAAVLLLGLLLIYKSVRSVVDLSERRSRFVSSVTHELKTPLTNIRLYVEMLEQGIASTPEREHAYLQVLGNESARLGRLIDNVLAMARLENKQRPLDLTRGCLEEVLDETRAIMTPKLQQEGFELVLQTRQAPVFTYDAQAMVQVLINLFDNSIKFGRQAPDRRITLTIDPSDRWARIAVADTGPGIPRRDLKRVFDDFYRADNTLTRATSGTGIGLALVRKLVRAMGGRVQAANNDGPGCTITLLLPLGTPDQPGNPAAHGHKQRHQKAINHPADH